MAIRDRRGAVVSASDAASASDPNPGLAYKTAVKCATTVAITLSGLQTIDGVAVAAGDRVLVKDQALTTTNGIYNAATGAWTRATDADSSPELTAGVQVLVLNGAVNGWKTYACTSTPPVLLDSSAILWTRVPMPNSSIPIILDGGGTTILTGDRVFAEVPFDCSIERWTMVSQIACTIVVDLYRATYANFPAVSSICGSSLPTLAAQQKNQDATLAGWSTSLLKGDVLTGHVVSVTGASLVTLSLLVSKS